MQSANFRSADGKDYLDKIGKCIAQSDPDATVILSSEHFHSRCIGPQIKYLRSMLYLAGIEVAGVIIYLRDQASMAVSSYSTSVMSGNGEAFSTEVISPFNPYFNHEQSCDQWAEAFSAECMKIRSYNYLKNDDIIEDLFECLDIVD